MIVTLEVCISEPVAPWPSKVDLEPTSPGRLAAIRQYVAKVSMPSANVMKDAIERHAQRSPVALVNELREVLFRAKPTVHAKWVDHIIAVSF